MTPGPFFWPQGTVFGTLLNSRAELHALGEKALQPPYKAAPKAPVLYIKTANTWSANGAGIPVPAQVAQVEIGASVALVIGATRFDIPGVESAPGVAGFVLLNDLGVPHADFFRPPVRFKCLDGFLGVGPHCVSAADVGDPDRLVLEVRINGELRQCVRFSDSVRDAATLLSDVSAFMALRAGDLLMLGCGADRPLAVVGDRIEISVPALPAFGTLTNTLVAQRAHTEVE
jgi:5-oxopent-3-ene-1,2,5-tricarboxylate decarboxylase/2-hydroxyhepta-2,4-diene-1,7-dioate isomerase